MDAPVLTSDNSWKVMQLPAFLCRQVRLRVAHLLPGGLLLVSLDVGELLRSRRAIITSIQWLQSAVLIDVVPQPLPQVDVVSLGMGTPGPPFPHTINQRQAVRVDVQRGDPHHEDLQGRVEFCTRRG